ncbi:ankyrin and het domain protein [Colletotrichum kahawae]|uniref:Ankyrin and het domain protein n=1 Tax=Colletotrichum kahawae TaxID=34407 RepID=A0AAD9YIU9_COLKA|nr:ankyrin and het domain protein [Colletotrichum kahawae]
MATNPGTVLAKAYKHKPLSTKTCTRIIEVFPATHSTDNLRCRLVEVELEEAKGSYEAVSYVWGQTDLCCRILVIDNENAENAEIEYSLPITQNLSEVLRRFRHTDNPLGAVNDRVHSDYTSAGPRLLWADGVCINQDSVDEKSHHIAMMTDIYTKAKGVLIWLGHDRKGEEALGSLPLNEFKHDGEYPPYIQNALHLPWFSRRWVIQEAVLNLNTEVYCGEVSRHLIHVGQSTLTLIYSQHAKPPGPRLLKRIEGLDAVCKLFLHKHAGPYKYYELGFTSLMLAFDEYECQDPRDRIFTLATLASDITVKNVTVEWVRQALSREVAGNPTQDLRTWTCHEVYINYEATAAEIYIILAYVLAINGKLGWLFAQASARLSPSNKTSSSHPDLDMLPQWVPNWTVKYHRDPFWLEGNDVRRGPWVNLGSGIGPPMVHCALARFPISSGAFAYRIRTRLGRIFRNQSTGIAEEQTGSFEADRFSPFVVTWKSETFPQDQKPPADVIQWIKRTFQSVWEAQLSELDGELHGGVVKDELADRFCYVLVAGANLYGDKRLDRDYKGAAAELAKLAQAIPAMVFSSDERNSRRLLDILVHTSQFWERIERSKDELLAPIIVKLLKEIIFNDPDISVPGWHYVIQMVSLTMEQRCVFTCDVANPPADASAFDIVGIGPDHLALGDRVFSLPLRRSHFRDGKQFEHPITKEFFQDVACAPLAFQNVWAATYLARPMGGVHVVHSQPVKDGAEPESPKVFQFVGDCFLSTVRWLSPSRGLMPKGWLSYETEDSDEAACQREFGDRYSDFDENGEIYLC